MQIKPRLEAPVSILAPLEGKPCEEEGPQPIPEIDEADSAERVRVLASVTSQVNHAMLSVSSATSILDQAAESSGDQRPLNTKEAHAQMADQIAGRIRLLSNLRESELGPLKPSSEHRDARGPEEQVELERSLYRCAVEMLQSEQQRLPPPPPLHPAEEDEPHNVLRGGILEAGAEPCEDAGEEVASGLFRPHYAPRVPVIQPIAVLTTSTTLDSESGIVSQAAEVHPDLGIVVGSRAMGDMVVDSIEQQIATVVSGTPSGPAEQPENQCFSRDLVTQDAPDPESEAQLEAFLDETPQARRVIERSAGQDAGSGPAPGTAASEMERLDVALAGGNFQDLTLEQDFTLSHLHKTSVLVRRPRAKAVLSKATLRVLPTQQLCAEEAHRVEEMDLEQSQGMLSGVSRGLITLLQRNLWAPPEPTPGSTTRLCYPPDTTKPAPLPGDACKWPRPVPRQDEPLHAALL